MVDCWLKPLLLRGLCELASAFDAPMEDKLSVGVMNSNSLIVSWRKNGQACGNRIGVNRQCIKR